MSNHVSPENVRNTIGQVMHPTIGRNLVESGMVKDIVLHWCASNELEKKGGKSHANL